MVDATTSPSMPASSPSSICWRCGSSTSTPPAGARARGAVSASLLRWWALPSGLPGPAAEGWNSMEHPGMLDPADAWYRKVQTLALSLPGAQE